MRAFEFKTPQSTTELADLLDKAKDKPKALNMLATGIDAILIATNKLLSKVKANEKNVVQEPKPVPKPALTPPPPPPPASPAIPTTNQIAKTESLEETTIQDIPSLKSKIDGIESNIKLLKTLKLGKQAILIVKQLEAQINEFEEEIKNALKEATDSYKSLDPYISNMLSKVNENNEQSIARARSIFLNDEIPIEEAKRFLEVAQTGVIDMIPMVKKSKGKLDQFVVNDPVVKRVYAKVIADFIKKSLRVSEIINLKLAHIDIDRMQVLIACSKGKKDRYVNFPQSLIQLYHDYLKMYQPSIHLFEGQFAEKYTTRSAQAVFKNAMTTAGISKTVGIHGLRHSYATHLLEAGTDMVFIQKLLGHSQIKTTEIYAKVSNRIISQVKSPLDSIN